MLPDKALTGAEPDSVLITLLEATLHHVPDPSPSCGGGFHPGNGTDREDTQHIVYSSCSRWYPRGHTLDNHFTTVTISLEAGI